MNWRSMLPALWVGILLCLASGVAGQSTTGDSDANRENPTDTQQLEELIATLENDIARESLVNDLKMLLKAQQQQEKAPLNVTEMLNLEEASDGLASKFVALLDQAGLNRSLQGQLLGFLALIASLWLLLFVNKRLMKYFNTKLRPLRRRLQLNAARFHSYFKFNLWFIRVVAVEIFIYVNLNLFDFWPTAIAESFNMAVVLTATLTVFLILLIFVSIWEWANFFMEFGSARNRRLSQARMQTLLPVVRNFLLFSLSILAGLMVLSEFGVDIMPLLAGAGVIGIAIGFGAQSLVSDFLTGFIVVFEDLLQVGDVVGIQGRVGIVEKITMRKVQLRGLDGTVYTVPFSEVEIVENLTKEYSYYLMDIGVAYREDVDEVIRCLKEIDQDMRESEKYGDLILDELQVLGVDKFADSAVVIKARIKTKAHDKWTVGREFNRRMKYAFDERNIEIPFPHQTLYFGEDKSGDAPRAQIQLHDEQSPGKDDQNKVKVSKQSKTETEKTSRDQGQLEEPETA